MANRHVAKLDPTRPYLAEVRVRATLRGLVWEVQSTMLLVSPGEPPRWRTSRVLTVPDYQDQGELSAWARALMRLTH